MYTYYACAALGYNSPLKHYLTQAQLIQFVIGNCATIPPYFISGCVSEAESLTLAGIQLYTLVLIYLFYQFYIESYTSKKMIKDKRKETKSTIESSKTK